MSRGSRDRPRIGDKVRVDESAVRRDVQAQILKMLPQIIREEIEAALRS